MLFFFGTVPPISLQKNGKKDKMPAFLHEQIISGIKFMSFFNDFWGPEASWSHLGAIFKKGTQKGLKKTLDLSAP